MQQQIINTIITFIISGLLGYCVSVIKTYKTKLKHKTENELLQNKALQIIIKNQLTNTYFVYSEAGQMPDYVYQNFLDMLKVYEGLNGDGYIHTLAKKMENWGITKTDIL